MTGNNSNQTDQSSPLSDVEEVSLDEEDASLENTQEEEDNTPLEVTDLSDVTNSKLLKQLVQRIESLEQENEDIKESVSTIEETLQELDKRVTILESRADHLNDSIESVEIEIKQNRDDINREQDTLEDRITAIEAELGLTDIDADAALTQPSCELERIANMPDEMRENEMSKNVNRAVIIWNHFDEWSQPVNKGQLLPSSEIKKLLAARLDTKLEWVQVHRVMEAFEKNTPDEYEFVETKSSGKSLLRQYND